MAAELRIAVEIAYTERDVQQMIVLEVAEGTTVEQAIRLSGLMERVPCAAAGEVGVYGRVVPSDTVLRNGDRVEIYRALVADPKQARRRRAFAPR